MVEVQPVPVAGITTEYRRAMERRGLAPGTITARTHELRHWLEHVGTEWSTAGRTQIDHWLDGRPLGRRARYTAISHLSAFYRWAIREGLCVQDPTILVERPRLPQQLPRPVTDLELVDLLAGAGDCELVVLLMVDAGLRCCEVARLRWQDVNLPDGVLYVSGKGAKDRMVGMPQRLRAALYLAEAEHRSVWVVGRQVTAARVSQMVGRRCRELGLVGVTAHRLRHTYATRLYRATGGDLRAVQQALGHSSVATTAIYAAVDVDRVVQVARLLD